MSACCTMLDFQDLSNLLLECINSICYYERFDYAVGHLLDYKGHEVQMEMMLRDEESAKYNILYIYRNPLLMLLFVYGVLSHGIVFCIVG